VSIFLVPFGVPVSEQSAELPEIARGSVSVRAPTPPQRCSIILLARRAGAEAPRLQLDHLLTPPHAARGCSSRLHSAPQAPPTCADAARHRPRPPPSSAAPAVPTSLLSSTHTHRLSRRAARHGKVRPRISLAPCLPPHADLCPSSLARSLKLASLLLRTLSKPIATKLKQQAKEHDGFKSRTVAMAQFMHRAECVLLPSASVLLAGPERGGADQLLPLASQNEREQISSRSRLLVTSAPCELTRIAPPAAPRQAPRRVAPTCAPAQRDQGHRARRQLSQRGCESTLSLSRGACTSTSGLRADASPAWSRSSSSRSPLPSVRRRLPPSPLPRRRRHALTRTFPARSHRRDLARQARREQAARQGGRRARGARGAARGARAPARRGAEGA